MKLDMSGWKQSKVGVARSLQLDPNNVRLGLAQGASQREILGALYREEDVLSLAKSIVNSGWLTIELPIALKEDNTLIVVEGNRRIAALKGLIQPNLVPEFQARLAKLALQTNVEELKKIRVILAPGAAEAHMLIAALHTGNLRKGWGRARQAVFFERLLDDGLTTQELVDGFPTVEVRDLLRRGSMRRLFLAGVQSDPDLFDYFNAPRTPMTVLERLTDNPDFLSKTQITLDDDFQASTRLDAGAFESLALKIVADMKSGSIDTRILNSPEDNSYQAYLASLNSVIADATTLGRTVTPRLTSTTGLGSKLASGHDQSKVGTQIDKGKSGQDTENGKPTRKSILDFSGIVVSEELPIPIKLLTDELSTLNYKKFPNATYDLLRSYLEKCIHAYANFHGTPIPPKQQGQAVGLEACLLWLEAHTRDPKNSLKNFHHPVQLLRNQKAENRSATLGLMNSVNHNPEVSVQHEHVALLWNHVHGIVKFLVSPKQG